MSPERVEKYRAFFRSFLAAVLARDPLASSASPESVGRDPWFILAVGRSGFTVSFDFGWTGSERVARVNFFIETRDKAQNEAFFDVLFAEREEIDHEFGEPLLRSRREDIKRCHVCASRPGSIDDPPEVLEEVGDWGVERLLRLRDNRSAGEAAAGEDAGRRRMKPKIFAGASKVATMLNPATSLGFGL